MAVISDDMIGEFSVSQSDGRTAFAPNPMGERLNNLFWEYRLGISTRGIVDVDHPDSYHYATMFYSTIHKILDKLQLQPSDVLVDVGSGKGRILCCAARRPVAKVVGVDLSTDFCDQARRNAGCLRGRRSTIEVHNLSAQEFNYAGTTVFTMFNPFGASTLDAVLSKIRNDTAEATSKLRFAYANPVHKQVFANHPWLEQIDEWDRTRNKLEHSVVFYCSR